jgi:hypothetical protein
MSGPEKASLFFGLPLELREEIYKGVFSARGQGLDILRTCHEIYTEARKCLYQQPIIFRSQHMLFGWLDQAPRQLLTYVSEISIHVQDVDLKPILDAGTSDSLELTRPRLLTPKIYHLEVQKLAQSLKEMPNVRTITIRALRTPTSFLYRDFIAQFFNILSTSCPGVADLRLEGECSHQGLQFLSSFKRLRSLSFDGFSSSSPVDTAEILANLEQLRTLALTSECMSTTPRFEIHGVNSPKTQSFTNEVMRALSQLVSFSVLESTAASPQNLVFTPEVLSSLHRHKTLKHLSVKLSHAPDTTTLVSLKQFLDKISIERLELDWPNLDPSVLKEHVLLSDHLQEFWVRAKNEAGIFEILRLIVESREAEELGKLKKVVLVRAANCKGKGRCGRKDSAMETEHVSLGSLSSLHRAGSMLLSHAKDCYALFV